MMTHKHPWSDRTWIEKFRTAFRGLAIGVHGQRSFVVHLSAMVAVIAAGIVVRVDRLEWCLLALCIAGVLTAELFNSALESLARAITHEENPHIGGALDIGSAAVLIGSLGAAVVGAAIFLRHLGPWLAAMGR